MALRNLKKEDWNDFGREGWRLLDPAGTALAVFAEFCRRLDGAYETRRRYCTVVARFLDYLYEVGMLGAGPVTRSALNASIDFYLSLLRSGASISLSTGTGDSKRYAEGDEAREATLRKVARRLEITPLASNSWDNTLAALNRFLRVCALLERESKEIALLKGGLDRMLVMAADFDVVPLIRAVDGIAAFSPQEVLFMKHSSMLGGVIRMRGSELSRPAGLQKSFRQRKQIDVNSLDFPEQHFPALLRASTSWRNRALWTLLLGCGIRRSEALSLQWCDIDFQEREIYVLDPDLLRYGRDIEPEERRRRFKGRTVSRTYFREPYRTWFFNYIALYRKKEYRLPADENDFVFQYLVRPYLGQAWYHASDETLNSAFTEAVERAEIPGPAIYRSYVWTAHSLRHAYGRFMLNDFAVPNQEEPGLSEVEVQLLMGHAHISSTRRYAKPRPQKLAKKLLAHDKQRIQGIPVAPCLPEPSTLLLNDLA